MLIKKILRQKNQRYTADNSSFLYKYELELVTRKWGCSDNSACENDGQVTWSSVTCFLRPDLQRRSSWSTYN